MDAPAAAPIISALTFLPSKLKYLDPALDWVSDLIPYETPHASRPFITLDDKPQDLAGLQPAETPRTVGKMI